MKNIIQNVYTCIEHIVQDSDKKEFLIVIFYTYTQDTFFFNFYFFISDIKFGSAFVQQLFLMLIIFAIFKKLDNILHTCVLNLKLRSFNKSLIKIFIVNTILKWIAFSYFRHIL